MSTVCVCVCFWASYLQKHSQNKYIVHPASLLLLRIPKPLQKLFDFPDGKIFTSLLQQIVA